MEHYTTASILITGITGLSAWLVATSILSAVVLGALDRVRTLRASDWTQEL